jgi:RNA polymerase primary sigma factor
LTETFTERKVTLVQNGHVPEVAMTLAQRLTNAMAARGMNQAALADAVGASPASVSLWCAGKKTPSHDNLMALARELGVAPSWLQFGDGASPRRDSRAERSEYERLLEWYWRKAPPDRGRELGNAAGFAFEVDIPTFARETGQNSLDELLEVEKTVRLDYTVIELVGDDLDRFLRVLQFKDKLRPHLEAAAEAPQKAATVIRAGLDDLDTNGRLLLVRVADYNASGLTGPEYDTGRFMAVCRNTLDSQKGETAGGSYGLGKATMWASSWMGLVLTNSTLSVPQDGVRDNRFFARLELPWHKLGSHSWAGPAWFGQPDPEQECTKSYAGNSTLAEDLYVDRDGEDPGTTFLVVGAYDPSGAAESVDDFAETLRRALAENFWPAMVERGTTGVAPLQVTVTVQRGRDEVSRHVVDPAEFVAPMVETLRKHYDDDVVDKLDQAGDVVREHVTLRVPARRGDGGHPAFDHEVLVLIAQAEEPEDGGQPVDMALENRVVYLRGNNMVIRDYRLRNLPFGARPFHAIVLAGRAVGDDPDNREAEKFLRAAEPPAHNKWTSTPEVTSQYERGGKKALDDLEDAIKDAIRKAVRGVTRNVSDGPESLKQLLRLITPSADNPKRPRVKSVTASLREDGAWAVEGVISVPPKSGRWQLSPVLKFGTESGPAISVEWAELEATANSVERKGRLFSDAKARTVSFRAVSDPATHPVSSARARVMVDIRDVRQVQEVDA